MPGQGRPVAAPAVVATPGGRRRLDGDARAPVLAQQPPALVAARARHRRHRSRVVGGPRRRRLPAHQSRPDRGRPRRHHGARPARDRAPRRALDRPVGARAPRCILVFAFLWGAAVSVAIALLVGTVVDLVHDRRPDSTRRPSSSARRRRHRSSRRRGKGLGLLIIFWAARKHFDGPVDGLVYAAWVAGGFAFTENILYFGSELLDSGGFTGSVGLIFLIRGIMSPFAHVMFTACTGIALGIAARRGVGRSGPSCSSSRLDPGDAPPRTLERRALLRRRLLRVLRHRAVAALRRRPARRVCFAARRPKLTHDRLSEYAAVGWFNPEEVIALATGAGRRQSLVWAAPARLGQGYEALHPGCHAARVRPPAHRHRPLQGQAEADEAVLLGRSSRHARRSPARAPHRRPLHRRRPRRRRHRLPRSSRAHYGVGATASYSRNPRFARGSRPSGR